MRNIIIEIIYGTTTFFNLFIFGFFYSYSEGCKKIGPIFKDPNINTEKFINYKIIVLIAFIFRKELIF